MELIVICAGTTLVWSLPLNMALMLAQSRPTAAQKLMVTLQLCMMDM